jgi:hypothetical protein
MTARRSATENGIPLYLIPHGIARRIKKQDDEVLCISVKRTHWHYYTISVRIKSLHKELRSRNERVMQSAGDPVDDTRSNGDYQGAI